MADLRQEGFKSSELFAAIGEQLSKLDDKEKKDTIKNVNGIFELHVTNDKKKEAVWTLDFKKGGTASVGVGKPKADCIISLSDDTLLDLASGKLNGQKAFMGGKLKVKGNLMLSTKLDGVLKQAKPNAKL